MKLVPFGIHDCPSQQVRFLEIELVFLPLQEYNSVLTAKPTLDANKGIELPQDKGIELPQSIL